MATVLGKTDCPSHCGEQAEVREGKAGGLTIYCANCKTQGFAKTPKAAAALRAKFAPPGDPKPPTSSTHSGAELDAFLRGGKA